MPDWIRLVRERLALQPLAHGLEDSVVEEIAAQLEDAWRDARARGAGEETARAEALALIDDWERLALTVSPGPTGGWRRPNTDSGTDRIGRVRSRMHSMTCGWPVAGYGGVPLSVCWP
jgi:hypothetical protein